MNELTELKRRSREAMNAALRGAGLPEKPHVIGRLRKLAPDDPLVLKLKQQTGVARHGRSEKR